MSILNKLTPNDEERFWGLVDIGPPDQCWIFLGKKTPAGYGYFMVDGKALRAHRIAWSLFNGDIPIDARTGNSMFICHTCDRPACVSVSHLWLGNAELNAIDRQLKRSSIPLLDRYPHFRDHPFFADRPSTWKEKLQRLWDLLQWRRLGGGKARGGLKLKDDQVREIRQLYGTGQYTQVQLAEMFPVSQSTISDIVGGRTWRHV